jgi:basic membrane protein A and related proteins
LLLRFDGRVRRAFLLVGVLVVFSGGGVDAGWPRERVRVGFVTDLVALNSRPVPRQIVAAMRRAERRLGVGGRVLARNPNEVYSRGVTSLARQRFDLVIGFSFQAADAVDSVALAFPQTRFLIVDYPRAALQHKPANVLGLVFREQEAGYLAGYLAGLEVRRRPGRQVVSSIGAYPNPPISRFIAGFQAGARKADPRVTLLNAFSLDYVDRAKCRSLALSQIARGSGAVFAVSGDCGLGALAAAKAHGVWAVGSEVDESALGAFVLTSAVKHTDAAVFGVIRSLLAGRFRGGDLSLGLRERGVGLGKISRRVPASLVRRVDGVRAAILAGRIRNIPTYPLVP